MGGARCGFGERMGGEGRGGSEVLDGDGDSMPWTERTEGEESGG